MLKRDKSRATSLHLPLVIRIVHILHRKCRFKVTRSELIPANTVKEKLSATHIGRTVWPTDCKQRSRLHFTSDASGIFNECIVANLPTRVTCLKRRWHQ